MTNLARDLKCHMRLAMLVGATLAFGAATTTVHADNNNEALQPQAAAAQTNTYRQDQTALSSVQAQASSAATALTSAQSAVKAASTAVNSAQTAVNNQHSQPLSTAQNAVNSAQSAVNTDQKAVNSASAAFSAAQAATARINTSAYNLQSDYNITGANKIVLNNDMLSALKRWVNGQETSNQLTNDHQYDKGYNELIGNGGSRHSDFTYKQNRADLKKVYQFENYHTQNGDIGIWSRDQIKATSEYFAALINPIRYQLGLAPVHVTEEAINAAYNSEKVYAEHYTKLLKNKGLTGKYIGYFSDTDSLKIPASEFAPQITSIYDTWQTRTAFLPVKNAETHYQNSIHGVPNQPDDPVNGMILDNIHDDIWNFIINSLANIDTAGPDATVDLEGILAYSPDNHLPGGIDRHYHANKTNRLAVAVGGYGGDVAFYRAVFPLFTFINKTKPSSTNNSPANIAAAQRALAAARAALSTALTKLANDKATLQTAQKQLAVAANTITLQRNLTNARQALAQAEARLTAAQTANTQAQSALTAARNRLLRDGQAILLRDGLPLTGPANTFRTVNGKVYYYGADGHLAQGQWYENWGHRYYFAYDGARVTGRGRTASTLAYKLIDGNIYAFDQQGIAYTGFLSGWGKLYYFAPNGARYTNRWYENWGHRYYFGADGARITGRGRTANTLAYKTIDGNVYAFDQQGIAYTGFLNGWGKLYYFAPNGARYTNHWYENWGHRYYFGADGARVTGRGRTVNTLAYRTIEGNTYAFDQDGIAYTGFLRGWGHTYYFDPHGARATNEVLWINGHRYTFDSNGVLV